MSQGITFTIIITDTLRVPREQRDFLAEFFWRQYLEKKAPSG